MKIWRNFGQICRESNLTSNLKCKKHFKITTYERSVSRKNNIL